MTATSQQSAPIRSTDGQALAAEYDLIVLGSGAGGMAAAIVAQSRGLTVGVFEKTDLVGGTTAVSGGACWVPANHLQKSQGVEDSAERAMTYLDNVVGTDVGRELRDVYLRRAPEAVKYLEDVSELTMPARPFTPDYSSDVEGAQNYGRVMVTKNFDGSLLGERFNDLRAPWPENCLFGSAMVDGPDLVALLNARGSLDAAWHALRFVLAHALDRVRHRGYRRGSRLTGGNAMVARLYKTMLDRKIPMFIGMAARDLVKERERIAGVAFGDIAVRARHGVVLATGGFPGGAALRKAHLPPAAGKAVYTAAPPSNTGDGISLATQAGGRFDDRNLNGAFWCPVSIGTRRDGSVVHFPHLIADRPKPGIIAVNRDGQRFVNESEPYHVFVQAMLRDDRQPVHFICDHRFIMRYPFGITRPVPFSFGRHERSGYLIKAATIQKLAGKIGVAPAALGETIARNNADARQGRDEAFGRGSTIYNRNLGDAANAPNPSLAPIERGPFYAIRIEPGDIGTAFGLAADADSRVLDLKGQPIAGLYACGNDRASVMGGAYPAGGITLGPVLTFAYLAAMHAADRAQKPRRDDVAAGLNDPRQQDQQASASSTR